MKYTNPIIKGFYPDPSVCFNGEKYYMVCSSFQYFPGVPLFESDNLVNWTQIGYVLTRENQVKLENVSSSGGVFAPTIRYNDGRFFMVTTNDTTHENFYVYTDDIYGSWSDPITVAQGEIDPSLYFENGRAFFISNGTDEEGESGVIQCEIDIETGKKLTESRCIWKGSGGRYLESPHMYKIGQYYYLMAAEGGTEYGHMITCARSESVWGSFESNPCNPILTNRNKAPYLIQGIGHGELICDKYGDWHIISLGFRQIGIWTPFHHLGREVFLTPAKFNSDGWFSAGADGTCDFCYEIKGDFSQEQRTLYTFENTDFNIDWSYMRRPRMENYLLSQGSVTLTGSEITLDEAASPTFIALRQRDFCMELSVDVKLEASDSETAFESGVTIYSCENEHYDICLSKQDGDIYAVFKLNIGSIKHIEKKIRLQSDYTRLIVRSDNFSYSFFVSQNSEETRLGSGLSKYLSSEVSEGFTGVMLGLYAVGDGQAVFKKLEVRYD